ncbi:MAG TPA: FecR domain-containing protein, partial [Paludibacter sp.]
MNQEKLLGYITGKITSEKEIVEILDWIEISSEHQKRYSELKNLWVISTIADSELLETPPFLFPKTKKLHSNNKFPRSWISYAAVFALAFILGSLTLLLVNRNSQADLSSKYNLIEVPYGKQSQVTLYDGTKVWLNSGTTFRYPVSFSDKLREVYMEGEAFFEVAKNAEQPFVVNAGQLKIQVLGTRFNVCAYPDDQQFSATLDEGSVMAINISNGKTLRLNPGEQVILDRETNLMNHISVDTALYTSWKENMLKFEDAPFEEVIKKMERWYDVKIKVDPSINT